MILEPNTQSSLDFSINNPADTASYYIQAVVRAVVSNKVIGTYNLSLVTGQYYRTPWTTPVDPTGTGYEIVIIFSVYTDAAYTQLSTIYGATMQKYIVRHLAANSVVGGGQGAGVDYARIEKLLRDMLAALPIPKSQEAYSDSRVLVAIEQVNDMLETMGEGMNNVSAFTDLKDALAAHKSAITSHIDGSVAPLAKKLDEHEKNETARHSEVRADSADLQSRIAGIDTDRMAESVDNLGKKLDDVHDATMKGLKKPVSFQMTMEGKRTTEPDEEEINVPQTVDKYLKASQS